MTIRLARKEDLEASHAIVKDATKHMDEQGIPQWDEIYPDKATLRQDIERQEMYVIEQNGLAVGIVVINDEQSPEYASITWTYAGRVLVVHRLTISPAHQRCGMASRLMKFAEDTAIIQGYDCIHLDAFTQNPAAFTLYDKLGYRKAGIVRFRKGEFHCYEKAIKAKSQDPNQFMQRTGNHGSEKFGMGSGYSYVWEFHVSVDSAAEFEKHYGPNGTWAALFRRAPGYVDTLLLADRSLPGRYITIDRWASEEAYLAFRDAFAADYAALDLECEKLTTGETCLGVYRE